MKTMNENRRNHWDWNSVRNWGLRKVFAKTKSDSKSRLKITSSLEYVEKIRKDGMRWLENKSSINTDCFWKSRKSSFID